MGKRIELNEAKVRANCDKEPTAEEMKNDAVSDWRYKRNVGWPDIP